jgi:hypothetical protein
MKLRKIALSVLSVIFIGTCLTGCTSVEPSAEQIQTQQTKEILKEVNNQIGLPNIKNFYEKKMAKEILEMRDNSKLITYAYIQNKMTGRFVYLGKSMGYGLPYSVQYTNPEKIIQFGTFRYSGDSPQTMPQADPNGLYMPSGLSATWIMLLDEKTGKRNLMYIEQELTVTQSKLPRRLCEGYSLPATY